MTVPSDIVKWRMDNSFEIITVKREDVTLVATRGVTFTLLREWDKIIRFEGALLKFVRKREECGIDVVLTCN